MDHQRDQLSTRSTPAPSPIHFAILEWVERRGPQSRRPALSDTSRVAVDAAVAELVSWELVTAVTVPRRGQDPPHWEPTGLTDRGRQALRRRQAERVTPPPWWKFW